MATTFQKRVKKVIEVSSNVFADKIICHADGTVSIKRGYYYHHGQSSSTWATKVMSALEDAGLNVKLVAERDEQKDWPKDSYFIAVVGERIP